MNDMNDRMVDGNAVGGLLSDVFAFEVTAAYGVCDGCGARRPLGALHVYTDAPGVVVRCPECHAVLLRLVHDDRRLWLDMRGLQVLQARMPD